MQADTGLGRSPCHRSPSVLWRLACELPIAPSPVASWASGPGRCGSSLAGSRFTRNPFHTRLRWPSLWCWTTASTIFCAASALYCEWPPWMTPGLLPAVPQLSALASRFTLHQFAVQHLLCPLLVFRLFLPVTDSDKLTKAHETKKQRESSTVLSDDQISAQPHHKILSSVNIVLGARRCSNVHLKHLLSTAFARMGSSLGPAFGSGFD